MLAPSDLVCSRPPHPGWVRLGGRVVLSAGHEHAVADAFARVQVLTRRKEALSPGELVLLRGRSRGSELVQAELIQRFRAPEPAAGGQFARQAWQGMGPRLWTRARVLDEIRGYFREHSFCEVDTPLLGPSPGFDAHVQGVPADSAWLVTSPEQAMKCLLVGGMPRIYQLSHVFRSEEQGPWHSREFLLLEWYRAFADMEAVIRDTEQIVLRVVQLVRGNRQLLLAGGRTLNMTPPYPRVSVADAFLRYAGIQDAHRLATENEVRFFELLVERVEPALAKLPHPVFLWRYPVSQAALARPAPDDPQVAERFELYMAGVELCNGFGELTDPEEHSRRLERAMAARRKLGRREQPADPRFLAALTEGMPPSAGNALGVDRLVALATGATTIAAVQP